MKNLNSTALRVENNRVLVLDQRLLPNTEKWIEAKNPDDMIQIIKNLQVRGAPLIGVAAAVSLARFAEDGASTQELISAAKSLNEARPTAVNLMLAMDRLVLKQERATLNAAQIIDEAENLFEEDQKLCSGMAEAGAKLIEDGDNILTHCNTGGLATAGVGTAFGVIHRAFEQGKKIHVYVDETRPLLQGGRLTTFELEKAGIPYTLICDSMASFLMKQNKVQKIFVGSDRIALNGDFANKVGTYGVAVSAKYHKVPFYVVAPSTTVDFECENGDGIPIEQRKPEEVRGVYGFFEGESEAKQVTWSPSDCETYNPAFDITPANLVTGMVLDGTYLSVEEIKTGSIQKMRS